MGIILIPMFVAMLLGFTYQGIKLGSQSILRARGRTTATLLLLAASAGLGLLSVVVPFALVSSSRVSAGQFVVVVTACVAGVAGLAGGHLKHRFRTTDKPVAGLYGAACFLAAGVFPIAWFALGKRLEGWFQVSWIY